MDRESFFGKTKDAVYGLLCDYARQGNTCPSDYEIAGRLKIRNPCSVQKALKGLEKDGKILRVTRGRGTRAINLIPDRRTLLPRTRSEIREADALIRASFYNGPSQEMLSKAHELRDPRTVVYNLSVVGGPSDNWVVNSRVVTDAQLLELYDEKVKQKSSQGAGLCG